MTQSLEERSAKQKNYYSHRYKWLKDHGLCVMCGHETPEPGKVMCLDCAFKNIEKCAARYKKMTPKEKQVEILKTNERTRNLRAKRKQNHECVNCGKKLPTYEKSIQCLECRLKRRKYDRAKREAKGIISQEQRYSGYWCFQCCKPIEPNPSKLCPECNQRNLEKLKKARNSPKLKQYNETVKKKNQLIFSPKSNSLEVL